SFLGSDGVDHLGLRVELDTESTHVTIGHRLPQIGEATRGRVPVVARVAGRLDQLLDHRGRAGYVGVAEAEVDDVGAGPTGRELSVVHQPEDVGRKVLDPAKFHLRKSRTISRKADRSIGAAG